VSPPSESGREDEVAGITPAELAAIGGRLEVFAQDVFESCRARTSVLAGSVTCAG